MYKRQVRDYTEKYPVCLVCKDVRTVVAYHEEYHKEGLDMIKEIAVRNEKDIITSAEEKGVYINVSGCNGMGTAGSGDVLTGVIAGMLAMGLTRRKAAQMGVYFHGIAGEKAAEEVGEHALCASDLLDGLIQVWKEIEKK